MIQWLIIRLYRLIEVINIAVSLRLVIWRPILKTISNQKDFFATLFFRSERISLLVVKTITKYLQGAASALIVQSILAVPATPNSQALFHYIICLICTASKIYRSKIWKDHLGLVAFEFNKSCSIRKHWSHGCDWNDVRHVTSMKAPWTKFYLNKRRTKPGLLSISAALTHSLSTKRFRTTFSGWSNKPGVVNLSGIENIFA